LVRNTIIIIVLAYLYNNYLTQLVWNPPENIRVKYDTRSIDPELGTRCILACMIHLKQKEVRNCIPSNYFKLDLWNLFKLRYLRAKYKPNCVQIQTYSKAN